MKHKHCRVRLAECDGVGVNTIQCDLGVEGGESTSRERVKAHTSLTALQCPESPGEGGGRGGFRLFQTSTAAQRSAGQRGSRPPHDLHI